jgi:hypothetical protein
MPQPVLTQDDDALLLQFVSTREIYCPVCKYNLHQLTIPRCPECGRALKLTVGAVEPFMAAWIFLAISLFASSGIGLLLTAFAAKGTLGPLHGMEVFAWWFPDASIPFALVAILLRRRFLRQPPLRQWLIAIAAAALTFAQISVFIEVMQ